MPVNRHPLYVYVCVCVSNCLFKFKIIEGEPQELAANVLGNVTPYPSQTLLLYHFLVKHFNLQNCYSEWINNFLSNPLVFLLMALKQYCCLHFLTSLKNKLLQHCMEKSISLKKIYLEWKLWNIYNSRNFIHNVTKCNTFGLLKILT